MSWNRNQRAWTESEAEFAVTAKAEGHGYGPISKALNRTRESVRGFFRHRPDFNERWRSRAFPQRPRIVTSWSEEEIALAKRLRGENQTFAAIARALGSRSASGVRHFFRELSDYKEKWHRPPGWPKGAGNAGRPRGARDVKDRVIGANRPDVSAAALADRDRRYGEHQTIGAILMGDPPFSQSALAKRGQ